MADAISALALVVRDYDEAIAFFTQALRFTLLEDTPLDEGKRWVRLAPGTAAPRGAAPRGAALGGAALLLAKATTPEQLAHVGNQTGGRVFLFLETRNFQDDYQHMQAHGVRFTELPRQEAFGQVVVFLDLYGNKWDLIERRPEEGRP